MNRSPCPPQGRPPCGHNRPLLGETLADRLLDYRAPDPIWDPRQLHYSSVSAAANARGLLFADLSEVGALLGFDCAVIGREYNAITVRRNQGEPDESGVIWHTVIHPDPEARAKAVLTLAPPQRWSANNPLQ